MTATSHLRPAAWDHQRFGLAPRHRRTTIVTASCVCAWLLPWSVALAATLPATVTARHWATVWAGLDLAEAVAAGSTAVLVARSDRRAGVSASILTTLLCVDAWFDICTAAPGTALAIAVAEAVCLELPLAAASAHVAVKLAAPSNGVS